MKFLANTLYLKSALPISGFQETTLATLCCPGFFQSPCTSQNNVAISICSNLEKHGRIFHTIFIYFVSGILYFSVGQMLRMNWFNQVIESPKAEDTTNLWIFIIYIIGAIMHTVLALLYYKVFQPFFNHFNALVYAIWT